jgi:hypothetical protein
LHRFCASVRAWPAARTRTGQPAEPRNERPGFGRGPAPPSSGLVDAALVALVLAAGGEACVLIGARPSGLSPASVITESPTKIPTVAPTDSTAPGASISMPSPLPPAPATILPARVAFNGAPVTARHGTVAAPTGTPDLSQSERLSSESSRMARMVIWRARRRSSAPAWLNRESVHHSDHDERPDETASKGFAAGPRILS